MKTRVAIIGGGPSGLFLSQLLDLAGIDNILLEKHTREYVLGRIRAGVLEEGTVELMHRAGIGARIDAEGMVHEGIGISVNGELYDIDVVGLSGGKVVTVYGQTEITRDLYDARDSMDGNIIHQAKDVCLHDIDSHSPYVTYQKEGELQRLDCDFIAGCDGFHGVSRASIPESHQREYLFDYPFGWLGLLSETPPVTKEVVYAYHDRGFALCSMRNPALSRYYIQLPLTEKVENWSDDRFWKEFRQRISSDLAQQLVTGPSVEKSIAPLRAFVSDTIQYGRLFLAGDAGHIVPPTGAKGLNLAASDIHYLSNALIGYYNSNDETGLSNYASCALDRIWKSMRFSMWCTRLLHRFPEQSEFENRIQMAELKYFVGSNAAKTAFSENYVGLPY